MTLTHCELYSPRKFILSGIKIVFKPSLHNFSWNKCLKLIKNNLKTSHPKASNCFLNGIDLPLDSRAAAPLGKSCRMGQNSICLSNCLSIQTTVMSLISTPGSCKIQMKNHNFSFSFNQHFLGTIYKVKFPLKYEPMTKTIEIYKR